MKKSIKTIIAVSLVFAIILSLTGCGEIKKAENTVNNMFAALKEGNLEAAQKYVDVDDFTGGDDGDSLTENNEIMLKAVFGGLEHKILSSEQIDGDTVTVKTEITATNMKTVMEEFIMDALSYAFAAAFTTPEPTEEEVNQKMEELFMAAATKPDLETVTSTVDIRVVRTEGNVWKIDADETFANAISGGLYEALDAWEGSFDDLSDDTEDLTDISEDILENNNVDQEVDRITVNSAKEAEDAVSFFIAENAYTFDSNWRLEGEGYNYSPEKETYSWDYVILDSDGNYVYEVVVTENGDVYTNYNGYWDIEYNINEF